MRFLPAMLIASATVVACLQVLPVLAFFYSVPFFLMFFSYEKKAFGYTVVFSCVLNAISAALLLAISPIGLASGVIVNIVAGSALFILPLLVLIAPFTCRLRYRVAIAGMLTSVLWVLFVYASSSDAVITGMLRESSKEVSAMLVPYIPSGYEGAVLGMQLSPEALYEMMLSVLLNSVLPIPVVMFTLCAAIGSRLSSGKRKVINRLTDISRYYADPFLFFPFAAAMCGIIAGKLSETKGLSIVSWNVALASGFYFFLQGAGILSFFVKMLRGKFRLIRFWFFITCTIVFLNGFLPQFAMLLLIVGVVELFVPLRARFTNTDIVHPTPGSDSDNA